MHLKSSFQSTKCEHFLCVVLIGYFRFLVILHELIITHFYGGLTSAVVIAWTIALLSQCQRSYLRILVKFTNDEVQLSAKRGPTSCEALDFLLIRIHFTNMD